MWYVSTFTSRVLPLKLRPLWTRVECSISYFQPSVLSKVESHSASMQRLGAILCCVHKAHADTQLYLPQLQGTGLVHRLMSDLVTTERHREFTLRVTNDV